MTKTCRTCYGTGVMVYETFDPGPVPDGHMFMSTGGVTAPIFAAHGFYREPEVRDCDVCEGTGHQAPIEEETPCPT